MKNKELLFGSYLFLLLSDFLHVCDDIKELTDFLLKIEYNLVWSALPNESLILSCG